MPPRRYLLLGDFFSPKVLVRLVELDRTYISLGISLGYRLPGLD